MSFENQQLLKNANDQLLRLVQQLHDLEECRDDMTEEEFNESKEDTKEQLRFETEPIAFQFLYTNLEFVLPFWPNGVRHKST